MFVNLCADSKIESFKYILVHAWHFLSELNTNVNKIAQPVCEYAIYIGLEYLYLSHQKKRNLVNNLFFTLRPVEMFDSAKCHL